MWQSEAQETAIPLFPLQTVLFPGGLLPLRIFEPRYLDMVSHCMKHGHGFGVCLIREGREVGEAAQIFAVGTLAQITDWNQGDDGVLGITAVGQRRFRVLAQEVQQDQLILGRVEFLRESEPVPLPTKFRPLADFLRSMIEALGAPFTELPGRYGEADWVGSRLLELLPLPGAIKQRYLMMDDPLARLNGLVEMLSDYASR